MILKAAGTLRHRHASPCLPASPCQQTANATPVNFEVPVKGGQDCGRADDMSACV